MKVLPDNRVTFQFKAADAAKVSVQGERIGSACSMLMEGNSGIAAVASQVGYRNLANFNRQFRAVKGVTPSQFRALYRRKGRVTFNRADPAR